MIPIASEPICDSIKKKPVSEKFILEEHKCDAASYEDKINDEDKDNSIRCLGMTGASAHLLLLINLDF